MSTLNDPYTINISSDILYDYSNVSSAGNYVLTTGTNGFDWGNITASSDLNSSTLQINGDANFEGDIKIKGKSIVDSLERIEERLAILHPNEELEEKWENLRGLRKAYMELEAEIKEKEEVWGILKK